MSEDNPSPALSKIAYFQNRRDEIPNQELARQLAETEDTAGIQEIAENLGNKNPNIQSDCLKVLYEIGYLKPELIAGEVNTFIKLLGHKNNRMLWGGMIALGTIADLKPQEIWAARREVMRVMEQGTVITLVWGVKTVAKVAAADPAYNAELFPVLLKILQTCIPRDVPTHGESILCAVDASNREQFLAALESRRAEMTASQVQRLNRVIRQASSK